MGMKDYTYASLFDKKDLSFLYKLAEKVRVTHNTDLITDYMAKCQKKVDDHNPILEIGTQKVEFVQVSKADDLVLTAGINWAIDVMLGIQTTRFTFMDYGTGTTAPALGDTALAARVGSISMTTSGWTEPMGMNTLYGGIFGEGLGSVTVNECAVTTNGSGTGIEFNRNMFSNNPLTHAVSFTGFIISSIIMAVPKVT